ncbi:TPA: phage tail protein [Providencia stuartii]
MKYFALLTKLGENLLAQATALGTKIELTHMAVGDGGGKLPTPDTNQTKLIAEKRRAAINTLFIDDNNKNQIVAEQIIPEKDGGWWIREIGLFDKAGNLIAVANCPETYKPQLEEGSGRTQAIRMVLIVSHTESVTLKIDPSVILATRDYVDDSVKKSIEEHEKGRKHPEASTTAKGFVQLADTLSEDNTKAITPKLATEINQRATNAQTTANTANTNATNANNNANNRVPSTRKVNNKPLSADINLTASDVGAYDKNESDNRFQPKGNYAPAGNYQPAGDYATNAALNNGLALKFDKTGGLVDGSVTAISLGVTRKSTNSTVYLYPASDAQQNGYAYFQYKIGDYWYGRVEIPRAESNQTTRLMQVGDYGIGISLPQSPTNFTSTTLGTGFYAMPGGTGNPWGNNGSAHIVNVRDGNYGFQIGRTTGNMNLSFRTLTAGAFSAISTLYSTANTVIDRNGCVKRTSYPDELSDYPVGAPIPWPQATAPSGYLICNGQWFNKTAYPLLTKAYPSGQLPDLRGEFIRGLDAGRNIDSGRAVLSAQSDDNKEHTHSIVLKNGNGNGSNDQASIRTLAVNVGNATYTTEKSGGKESRPRNIAFLYIVRAA